MSWYVVTYDRSNGHSAKSLSNFLAGDQYRQHSSTNILIFSKYHKPFHNLQTSRQHRSGYNILSLPKIHSWHRCYRCSRRIVGHKCCRLFHSWQTSTLHRFGCSILGLPRFRSWHHCYRYFRRNPRRGCRTFCNWLSSSLRRFGYSILDWPSNHKKSHCCRHFHRGQDQQCHLKGDKVFSKSVKVLL